MTKTHGRTGTPEYICWSAIVQRCTNKNATAYDRYGGAGIRICDRWKSFENFLFDMGSRPSAEHSVDRIDNSGDYTPENCRWATYSEQARNTSRNRLVTYEGEEICVIEAVERSGLPYHLIQDRLDAGWPDEQVFSPRKKVHYDPSSMIGKRYGHLEVVQRVENDKHRAIQFLCLCDCGTQKVVASSSLRRGTTKSCGCHGKGLAGKAAND